MDNKEETPNEETKKLFDGVEKGDKELVKVLFLGKTNKQFELDINFQFKHMVYFFFLSFLNKKLFFLSLSFLSRFSFVFSLFLFSFFLSLFVFYCLFFLTILFFFFCSGNDCSAQSCSKWFCRNCEPSSRTWIRCSSPNHCFLIFFFFFLILIVLFSPDFLFVVILWLFHMLCCVFFLFFFEQLLLLKGWMDRSSLCCWWRFCWNCENSYWTRIQCWSSK